MAYTTIDDPSAHFQTAIWTGDGSTSDRNITNDGNSNLQPDWIWGACRSNVQHKHITDSSRGFSAGNKELISNQTNLEGDTSAVNTGAYGWLGPSLTDGFESSYGSTNNGYWNVNARTYVAWQWKANGGTTSSNTDGNITTTIQTNSTAGFTIGTYTGTGGDKTIGHGLGAIPDLVIIKGRDGNGQGGAAQYWVIGAPNILGNGTSNHVFLDTTNALMSNTTVWRNTNFTSTTIPLGGHAAINGNTAAYVFYAFKEIQGYSKIGDYYGNGITDGTFIHCGFKPAFFLVKNLTSAAGWRLFDNKRIGFNNDNYGIAINETDVEDTSTTYCDILSTGVKMRGTSSTVNQASNRYLYIAFAENPFVSSSGVPNTAR
tara:strand:- start:1496 stop:2614 length:1119 start_codon:yes stop_codon:yes gene_type:complete